MRAENNPYRDMKVVLRHLGADAWLLTAVEEGQVLSSTTIRAPAKEALSRAETLAGWFGADLAVEGHEVAHA